MVYCGTATRRENVKKGGKETGRDHGQMKAYGTDRPPPLFTFLSGPTDQC